LERQKLCIIVARKCAFLITKKCAGLAYLKSKISSSFVFKGKKNILRFKGLEKVLILIIIRNTYSLILQNQEGYTNNCIVYKQVSAKPENNSCIDNR